MTWQSDGKDFWRSSPVDYGVADNKGRRIGGFGVINLWREGVYDVRSYATRDGHKFGAIPRGTRAETLEEAKVLGAKKLADAAKRYAKLVAKGEGKQFKKG